MHKPVTLADGRVVDSYSEEWRAECEARYMLAMPHEKRPEQFELIGNRRSPEALAQLKERMAELEPRYVLALPGRDQRRAYAAKVEYYQGQNAREALEAKVRALWEAQKVAAAAEQTS